MATLQLSRQAKADLAYIESYSVSEWGVIRAINYVSELRACCQTIADHPHLGLSSPELRAGLRRFQKNSHVIFYRVIPRGIRVSRILHRRMMPAGRLT